MNNTATIAPQDAAGWLVDHGWQQVSPPGKVASLWRRDDREVLLPLRTNSADFSRRASQLLLELSMMENKSPDLLQIEMLNVGADICEWRADHSSLIDDSIPLSDGETLISSAKTAFIAAASATIHRRGYFGHSVPQRARDHAKAVRMGQTQRGSYMIPIISRLPTGSESEDLDTLLPISDGVDAIDESSDLFVTREPFSRQVMGTLVTALGAVRDLAEAGTTVEHRRVNESVGDGVSHELCAALANSLKADSVGSLNVSFSWARRLPSHGRPTETISFPKEIEPAVSSMTEALRGSAVVATQTIVGSVYSMRKEDDSDRDLIVVRTAFGGDRRHVRVKLPAHFRHVASRAYDENLVVFVVGKLSRQAGRSWEISEVGDFGLAHELHLGEWENTLGEDGR
jgi:hypothetical protein